MAIDLNNIICTRMDLVWKNILIRMQKYDRMLTKTHSLINFSINFLFHFCDVFNKLRKKWGVNWFQFTLIFCTFALGGSLCGYLGRKLLGVTDLEKGVLYFVVYIVVITCLWPLCVIIISIPFGQFNFFRAYLERIWGRIAKK